MKQQRPPHLVGERRVPARRAQRELLAFCEGQARDVERVELVVVESIAHGVLLEAGRRAHDSRTAAPGSEIRASGSETEHEDEHEHEHEHEHEDEDER